MRKRLMLAVLLCVPNLPALSQQPATQSEVTTSTPGRVATPARVKGSAVVTAIDSRSRKLSLKQAPGGSFDLVAPEEVRNFEQIRSGNEVEA